MFIIPVMTSFIGVYLILYVYYLYSSLYYIRIASEKQIFYINTIITTVPPLIYSYNIFNMMIYNIPLENFILQNFILEWSITTPLILLNITYISKVKLFKQLILLSFSVLMNVFGYIANGVQHTTLLLAFYGAGCVCLSIIFMYLVWIYYKRNWVLYKDSIQYKQYIQFINSLFYILICSWILYPVVFLLYKFNTINLEYTVLGFMILDFISKGVFIGNILQYQNILYMTDSFTNQIMIQRQTIPLHASNQIVPFKEVSEPASPEVLHIEII